MLNLPLGDELFALIFLDLPLAAIIASGESTGRVSIMISHYTTGHNNAVIITLPWLIAFWMVFNQTHSPNTKHHIPQKFLIGDRLILLLSELMFFRY